MTQPVVHYHFRSKADLYEEVLTEEVAWWVENVPRFRDEATPGDPASFLRLLGTASLEREEGNQLFRVLGSDDYERFGPSIVTGLAKANEMIGEALAELAGDRLRVPPRVLTQLFVTSIAEASAMREFEDAAYGIDSSGFLDDVIDAVLNGAVHHHP